MKDTFFIEYHGKKLTAPKIGFYLINFIISENS